MKLSGASVAEDTALLVTHSRDLAVGLAALLLSIPPIRHVERATGPDTLVERLRGTRPVLVVLDTAAIDAKLPDVLNTIHEVSPRTRFLVLSDTVNEERQVRQEAPPGAGTVVVKGADPERLADTIQHLLTDPAA